MHPPVAQDPGACSWRTVPTEDLDLGFGFPSSPGLIMHRRHGVVKFISERFEFVAGPTGEATASPMCAARRAPNACAAGDAQRLLTDNTDFLVVSVIGAQVPRLLIVARQGTGSMRDGLASAAAAAAAAAAAGSGQVVAAQPDRGPRSPRLPRSTARYGGDGGARWERCRRQGLWRRCSRAVRGQGAGRGPRETRDARRRRRRVKLTARPRRRGARHGGCTLLCLRNSQAAT